MTARKPSPPPAGIVEVRFRSGDESGAGFLVRILRDHPEVEMIRQPKHYSGGRVYTAFLIRRRAACGRCGCRHHRGCACTPDDPQTCPCCNAADKPVEVHQ